MMLLVLGVADVAGSDDRSLPEPGQELYYVSGSEPASSEDLSQYQEFYSFDQGSQAQAGPIQYMVSGSEPESLVVGGQSKPYDPSSIPVNSLWILGSTRWAQYIKCPIGASFSMLALSNGGPVTMVETYPDGYQLVNRYNFYPGYTQLVFEADAVGRHTLSFSTRGQVSNAIAVDVMPYSRPYSYGGGYESTASSGWGLTYTGGEYVSRQSQYGWGDGYDG